MNSAVDTSLKQPELYIQKPFALRNGTIIKNRLIKSAMSEALGTIDNIPTPKLATLYRQWANGGIGLNITGNVMVDARALGEPGNVVLENDKHMSILKQWAHAGTANNTHLWMQINHPGKQVPKGLNRGSVAPSAIGFGPDMARFFEIPRALTETEILDIIQRFATTSAIAKQAGFTGVQIHGAHGYLVSQFLSPNHNKRTDQWGGTLNNRMRFVREVYKSIRANVGEDFPVSIKLNSADFQKGGFTEEESIEVIRTLTDDGMDLIEISGGTYESPVMANVKQSTYDREAYFLKFAETIRQEKTPAGHNIPLAVTGGFRTTTGMADALALDNLDMIGIARPLVVDPNYPKKILAGQAKSNPIQARSTGIKFIDNLGLMEVAWYTRQLHRMGQGKAPKPNEGTLGSLVKVLLTSSFKTFKTRRLRAS
ncbi:MAG: NADH:flavin oxidoreductase/NADH oxidase family protein [Pseudomonadales bacterium]|nr:NADH:flavin oxidoreductase/NADH oxidase family protein [Pseudomonadales bacterium]